MRTLTHDQLKAASYFRKRAKRILDKAEDRDDYVQECFAVWSAVGRKADVRLVAKSAARNFFQDQFGELRGKRYEFTAIGDKDLATAATISFADALDTGIPANRNDAAAARPYAISVNGTRVFMDRHDLGEVLGLKEASIKTYKSLAKPIVLWEHDSQLYRSLVLLKEKLGCRMSTAKGKARKVEIKWL